MNKLIRTATGILLSVLLVTGCETTGVENKPLNAFEIAKPRSILVVPVVNNSTDVQAPTSVLATLPFRLAEKGYYVYPVNTVKTLLEYEGLYEPAQIHNLPPEQLALLFKADSILYVTINEWTAKYIFLSTTTEVNFHYRIVNADGAELWSANKELTYTPETRESGNPLTDLIAAAISAAIERAAPNYLPLTRQAHDEVFSNYDLGLPPGPYSPAYNEHYGIGL